MCVGPYGAFSRRALLKGIIVTIRNAIIFQNVEVLYGDAPIDAPRNVGQSYPCVPNLAKFANDEESLYCSSATLIDGWGGRGARGADIRDTAPVLL